MAEAEALHERLVGLVVHLGKQLAAGGVVRRPKTLAVTNGPLESGRERTSLAGEAQLAPRRGQHEARLAALAGVLD
jgi:hypothetical protein